MPQETQEDASARCLDPAFCRKSTRAGALNSEAHTTWAPQKSFCLLMSKCMITYELASTSCVSNCHAKLLLYSTRKRLSYQLSVYVADFNDWRIRACVCVCACACACGCGCVCVCVWACVRACVCVCVCACACACTCLLACACVRAHTSREIQCFVQACYSKPASLQASAACGSLMHPDFLSLMHPGFLSHMHPDIFYSFWNFTKHWEFSCNGGSHFFLACAPWRPLRSIWGRFCTFPCAVAWHGANFWTSLANTQVWSLWSDLQAGSQHLSQVTSKALRFLQYIRCYVVASFSSNLHNACDAML